MKKISLKKISLCLLFTCSVGLFAAQKGTKRDEITFEDTQKRKKEDLRRLALERKRASGARLTIPEQVERSRLGSVGVVH